MFVEVRMNGIRAGSLVEKMRITARSAVRSKDKRVALNVAYKGV
jgi:hypothetical protein